MYLRSEKTKICIRHLVISPPVFLAPMAGVTHTALRTLILDFGGVGLLSTEMLSARRLPNENEKVSPYLIRTSEERPLSYQLFVTDPEEVPAAIDSLHHFGADAIDVNMGCPAPRVRSAGGGAKLMDDVANVRKIIAGLRRSTALPVSAKIRLGARLDKGKLRDFCLMLEGEGIDYITVHARLRGENFQRKPRWEWVGFVKEWVSVPVIANGSIFSVEDARNCLAKSGADGLMIGRAAPEKPWIFAELAREIYGVDVPARDIVLPCIYSSMVRNLKERFRPERRLGRLKEFTHYFCRNYSFGHRLASAVQSSDSIDTAWQRAASFFSINDPAAWEEALKRIPVN